MIKRKPRLKTGLSIKGLGILSSDPGETRTHGQWLKRTLAFKIKSCYCSTYRSITGKYI